MSRREAPRFPRYLDRSWYVPTRARHTHHHTRLTPLVFISNPVTPSTGQVGIDLRTPEKVARLGGRGGGAGRSSTKKRSKLSSGSTAAGHSVRHLFSYSSLTHFLSSTEAVPSAHRPRRPAEAKRKPEAEITLADYLWADAADAGRDTPGTKWRTPSHRPGRGPVG